MKKKLLLTVMWFNIFIQTLMAQLPSCQWALNINNITGQVYSNEEIMKIDNTGNVYVYNEVFGYSYQDNLILTKINSNGMIIWSKNFGGIGNERARDIFFDNDNNIYITGTFNSPTLSFDSVNVTGNNLVFNTQTNITDYFVTKLDSNGNVIWVKSSGTNSNNWIVPYLCYNLQGCLGVANVSLTVDKDGHIYIVGNTLMSSLNINNIVIQNTQNKCFILKFDLNGNILWSKIIGSNGLILNEIKTDSSGNIFIRGSFSSATTNLDGIILTNTFSANNTDYFISKFNSTGNIAWAKKIGGGACKSICGFDVNLNGEVLIGGNFGCLNGMTIDNQVLTMVGNNWDGFMAKFDINGNIQWKKAVGGIQSDYIWGVKLDNSGNAYGIGNFFCCSAFVGNITLTGISSEDIFVMKFNQLGNTIWAYRLGGMGTDYGYYIDIDNEGSFYIQGNIQDSSLPFCNTTITSNGPPINFITKYFEDNLNLSEFKDSIFTISPNPASTQININFNDNTDLNGGTIKIINSLGQQVVTTPITVSGTNTSIQLATWGGAGMYFVQIINPQGQIMDVKKIIIQ